MYICIYVYIYIYIFIILISQCILNFIEQYDAQVANLGLERNTSILGPSSGIFTENTRVPYMPWGRTWEEVKLSPSLFFSKLLNQVTRSCSFTAVLSA